MLVDTDGDVTVPAAWFTEVGARGLLPLERMAGVDIAALRKAHPKINLIGAFDKTVMHLGEDRMPAGVREDSPCNEAGWLYSCLRSSDPAPGFAKRLPDLRETAQGVL